MGHGQGDPKKVVVAALLGNGGIAIAKFVAAFMSGSATMLAEAVHSVADTTNQAFLLLGMSLSEKTAPETYPLGRSKEAYFWAFIVSLFLFFLGGVFAVYEGIHKLTSPAEAPGSQIVPIVVLVVSIAIETVSFSVAIREFNKQRGGTSIRQALFDSRDPTIPVVLLEDAGAVFGLVFALVAVVLTMVTGDPRFDGVGSIVIGVLLCIIGVVLARDTRSLLIGEGITKEMRERVLAIASETPAVLEVRQLLSMHMGPTSVVLALKVRFEPGLTLPEVEAAIDDLEHRIRAEVPAMKKIFVEPDSRYDSKLDADLVAKS